MHVSELAQRADIPADVVRYYTQMKLQKPKRDPGNRYRKYAESDVYRLRFIRRAKWLGFTLRDVRAISRDADGGMAPCSQVRNIIKERARKNHQCLDELNRLQMRVEDANDRWETMPDRLSDHESLCDLIDAVAEAEGNLT